MHNVTLSNISQTGATISFKNLATYFEWTILIIQLTNIFWLSPLENADLGNLLGILVTILYHSTSESPSYMYRNPHFMSLGDRKGPLSIKTALNV